MALEWIYMDGHRPTLSREHLIQTVALQTRLPQVTLNVMMFCISQIQHIVFYVGATRKRARTSHGTNGCPKDVVPSPFPSAGAQIVPELYQPKTLNPTPAKPREKLNTPSKSHCYPK